MKKKLVVIMLFMFSLLSLAQTKVTFINPGKSTEGFWVAVSSFMEASAEDLDLDFEVIYAERNFLKAVTIMKDLAARSQKPDYVVIVNEKLVAPKLLKVAEDNGIKTFMILNGLNEQQMKAEGAPRAKNSQWLGSLIPNNVEAGYLIADSLIKTAKKAKGDNLKLVAIAGNRATPASVQRVEGMKKALKENPTVKLSQTLYAEWDQNKSYTITAGMLSRYKDIDIIWAVNDPIAFGALKAVEEKGLKPGDDIYVGGLNWSPEALKKIKNDEMVCTVGGHFMVGGWSLVILKDHAEGRDFAKEEGDTELKVNVFGLIDKTNVDGYAQHFGDSNWSKIDFKKFSKHYNSSVDKYNFSLEKILEQF
jgi:ABC-type sugar transport system substrate-binding protein